MSVRDLSREEILFLIETAVGLKRDPAPTDRLRGKAVALLFEKPSTRTRCSFAVAAVKEGAHPEYLSRTEMHLGKKESVEDTAKVLGRYFDGILFRGFLQSTVETIAASAGVPVWNGLTDTEHPLQTVADLMTVWEHFGALEGLKVVFVGDGRNNVACSLMEGCARMGMHFVVCSPEELEPPMERMSSAASEAEKAGGSVRIEHDPEKAVEGANVVYTDVWTSMGEEDMFQERMRILRPYQVTMEMMRNTGNLDSSRVIFLHCLPALHDSNTGYTSRTGALEVTDEVFRADFSKVFDLAENRLHTSRAVLVSTLS